MNYIVGHLTSTEFFDTTARTSGIPEDAWAFGHGVHVATNVLTVSQLATGAIRIINEAAGLQSALCSRGVRCDLPSKLGEVSKRVIIRCALTDATIGFTFGVNKYVADATGYIYAAPHTGFVYSSSLNKFGFFMHGSDNASIVQAMLWKASNLATIQTYFDTVVSSEITNLVASNIHTYEFSLVMSKGTLAGLRASAKIDGHLFWVPWDDMKRDADILYANNLNVWVCPNVSSAGIVDLYSVQVI
jgi:hypothetical protein